MNTFNKDSEKHFCKTCGCELTSTNKSGICEYCRRMRSEKIRKGVLTALTSVGGVIILVLTKGKIGGNKV